MSWKVQALVGERVCGSMLRKMVLINMAARANDDGSGVFAAIPTIAAWCEVDARSVRRVLRALEEDGLIRAVGSRVYRGKIINEWELDVGAIWGLRVVADELQERRERAASPDTESGQARKNVRPKRAASPLKQAAEPPQPAHLSPDSASGEPPDTESGRTLCPGKDVLPRTQSPPNLVVVVEEEGSARAPGPLAVPFGSDPKRPKLTDPAAQRLIEACASPWLDPEKALTLVTDQTRVSRWLREGADLELDVIPVWQAKLASWKPDAGLIRTFEIFERNVRRAAAKRLAADRPIQPAVIAAEEPDHVIEKAPAGRASAAAISDRGMLEALARRTARGADLPLIASGDRGAAEPESDVCEGGQTRIAR